MGPWQEMATLARLVPTPHNTQPFRIRPRGERAELVLLTDRLLPREDHGNLYVTSAFGIFAATLERAGLHFGRAVRVTPVADLETEALETRGPQVVLGEATITGSVTPEPAAELLDARRTSRLPYHDRPIDPAAFAAFARITEAHGHRFVEYSDPNVVGPLLTLNAEAIIDNLAIREEREEIRVWSRYGETPQYGDGLWCLPMNQPAWELSSALAVPWAFRLPGIKSFAVRRYVATQRGTRHIALVCGAFRRWPELYVAGRMLLELWLEMARRDVYIHPMGSMLTNARYAAEIACRFSCDDCWLVFRLGYSDPPPRSPRLADIVLP